MDLVTSQACTLINQKSQILFDLSQKIWELAEPGGEEFKSCDKIVKFLRKNSFKVTTNLLGMPTSFLAEYGKNKTRKTKPVNIIIICCYDAVKGKGHLHGNNLVATAAVATVLGIKDAINSSNLLGKISLLGYPDSCRGRLRDLASFGAFKGFHVCLSAVPGPRNEWYSQSQSYGCLRGVFHDSPQNICGEDLISKSEKFLSCPLNASILSHTNVQVTQQHFDWNCRTAGAITYGSSKLDKPTKESEVVFKLQAPTDWQLGLMEKRIMPCFQAAAQAAGCGVQTSNCCKRYRSFIPNTTLADQLKLNAYSCGLLDTPLKPYQLLNPVDIASVSHILPTLRPMFYIGYDHDIGTKQFKDVCNTTRAHAHTLAMARALTMTAVELMRTPKLLDTAAYEFKTRRAKLNDVDFEPFPKEEEPRKFSLSRKPPIADCNIGWSKR